MGDAPMLPWSRPSVTESWDRRIRRADELAAVEGPAAPLLAFYARLLRGQKAMYDSLDRSRVSGEIERDAPWLAAGCLTILDAVIERGSAPLAAQARTLVGGGGSRATDHVLAYRRQRPDSDFFGKAFLQPYAQWLVDHDRAPSPGLERRADRCPHCGGAPQLSVLDAGGPDQGGSRQLQCATCLSRWAFPRVACPGCGERDEHRLEYFHSPAFDHVRIDACESCRRYVKTVDLGRLGLAVPLVDEIAAAPLDAWAREHAYQKIELNLIGF